jgi:hypothetical protein
MSQLLVQIILMGQSAHSAGERRSRVACRGIWQGVTLMRNTNRGTLAARAFALFGSTLMAVALLASPGYAGPDRADQGHNQGQSMREQISQLRQTITHRGHAQGSPVQSNGSGDVECTGFLSGDFDRVTVPPGEFCLLTSSTVASHVTAERDSRLLSVGNTIGGNLVGVAHDTLLSLSDRVGGNVRLQGGTGVSGEVDHALCDDQIRGSVSLERNDGFIAVGNSSFACGINFIGNSVSVIDNFTGFPDRLDVQDNFVGGQMKIEGNRGNGAKTVQDNTINATLDCKENRNPFIGTPNNADRARGQCAP